MKNSAILAAMLAVLVLSWGTAVTVNAQPASPPEASATEAEPAELSEEDKNAAPLPPGRHAALVKKVCTECHMAGMFLTRHFSYDEAVRIYKLMVTENIETDQARNVIEYLSTTLGR